MPGTPLELDAVVRRFGESAAVLDDLRERLRALALAEDQRADASATLSEVAVSIRAAADRLAVHTDALVASGQAISIALEHGRSVFAALDPAHLKGSMDAVRAALADMATRQEAQHVTLADAVTGISTELRMLTAEQKSSIDSLQRELDELKAKVAAVPARTRAKLGL
jgi:uncharacterized protein YlxW (UPF0749 family)